jgi:hypothetical protein
MKNFNWIIKLKKKTFIKWIRIKYEIKKMKIEIENQTTKRIIIYLSSHERKKQKTTTHLHALHHRAKMIACPIRRQITRFHQWVMSRVSTEWRGWHLLIDAFGIHANIFLKKTEKKTWKYQNLTKYQYKKY